MTDSIFSASALAGRVALITGASRGIGRAILESFAHSGATVIGTATTEAGAQAITEALGTLGAEGEGVILNVNDAERSEAVIADVLTRYGHLDVLVNNAGITQDTLTLRMKDEQWQAVIDTNLTAAFRLARAVVRPMMRQRSGRIISISSVVGAMGNAGQVNYAAAKAGLMGMTMALAREIGSRGITVNCVAPGFIDTDMTAQLPEEHKQHLLSQIPLARLGDAKEVANACVYLASDAGAYITGTTLHVNGGMYMG